MTKPFQPSLRLKPSILTLFILLTVPVLATIIILNYVSNNRIARANGQELVDRFRHEAMDSIQAIFDPIKSLVRAAAVLGDQQSDSTPTTARSSISTPSSSTAPRSSASMPA